MIGVHPWQLALFSDKAQQEMWSDDPATMHSSSYDPTGKAEKVAGGYKISGRWSFSTGCDHCRGVMLGAICGSREIAGNQVRDFRSFLLTRDQYQIEDNWHVAGLKGTGSKDIVVEETFVPDYRTQSHLDYAINAPLPGQEVNPGPLYRLPWSVVFNMALAASALGSARGFVDAWTAASRDRKLNSGGRSADDAIIQQRLAEAVWYLDASGARIRADAIELWQMAEAREPASMQIARADALEHESGLRARRQGGRRSFPDRERPLDLPGASAPAPVPGCASRIGTRILAGRPAGASGRRDAARNYET